MVKVDFIPKKAVDLNELETQIIGHIDEAALVLGLPAASVTTTKSLITAHQTAYNEKNAADLNYKKAVEKNKQAELDAVSGKGGLREFAKFVKSQPGYTQEIDAMLGIEGSESILDLTNVKPVLTVSYEGLNVIIRFKKQGSDGVKIFSRRGDETSFSFLAIDTESPYIDSRPKINSSLPETREYQAVHIYKDEPVGQMSDTIKFTIQ